MTHVSYIFKDYRKPKVLKAEPGSGGNPADAVGVTPELLGAEMKRGVREAMRLAHTASLEVEESITKGLLTPPPARRDRPGRRRRPSPAPQPPRGLAGRIGALERKVAALRSIMSTVYQRTYARTRRRSKMEQKVITQAQGWARLLAREKGAMVRLGHLIANAKRGQMVFYVSRSERQALKAVLKRRADPAPRRRRA